MNTDRPCMPDVFGGTTARAPRTYTRRTRYEIGLCHGGAWDFWDATAKGLRAALDDLAEVLSAGHSLDDLWFVVRKMHDDEGCMDEWEIVRQAQVEGDTVRVWLEPGPFDGMPKRIVKILERAAVAGGGAA